jgi:hypothetical protein
MIDIYFIILNFDFVLKSEAFEIMMKLNLIMIGYLMYYAGKFFMWAVRTF